MAVFSPRGSADQVFHTHGKSTKVVVRILFGCCPDDFFCPTVDIKRAPRSGALGENRCLDGPRSPNPFRGGRKTGSNPGSNPFFLLVGGLFARADGAERFTAAGQHLKNIF